MSIITTLKVGSFYSREEGFKGSFSNTPRKLREVFAGYFSDDGSTFYPNYSGLDLDLGTEELPNIYYLKEIKGILAYMYENLFFNGKDDIKSLSMMYEAIDFNFPSSLNYNYNCKKQCLTKLMDYFYSLFDGSYKSNLTENLYGKYQELFEGADDLSQEGKEIKDIIDTIYKEYLELIPGDVEKDDKLLHYKLFVFLNFSILALIEKYIEEMGYLNYSFKQVIKQNFSEIENKKIPDDIKKHFRNFHKQMVELLNEMIREEKYKYANNK